MKRLTIIVFACLLTLTASTAFGQSRQRRTTTRRSRPASNRTQDAASSNQATASRIAEQIKSIGKFLYLYGPISKELAGSEREASAGGQASAATETMQRNRAKLRDVFRTYRVQMDELETTFSSSTELRAYYAKLIGVAASSAQAEDAVAAGRYDEAGKALLDVMNRLTDVLLVLR